MPRPETHWDPAAWKDDVSYGWGKPAWADQHEILLSRILKQQEKQAAQLASIISVFQSENMDEDPTRTASQPTSFMERAGLRSQSALPDHVFRETDRAGTFGELNTASHSCIGKFVTSFRFDIICAAVVVLNTIYEGVRLNTRIDYALTDGHDTELVNVLHTEDIVEGVFLTFYALELGLKIFCLRLQFFRARAWWNFYDLVLVVAGTLKYITLPDGIGLFWLRVLRVAGQIIKALRIFRVVRFCKKLRVIMISILRSTNSFMWSMVSLALIMYMCAIVFLDGIANLLADAPLDTLDGDVRDALLAYWASIPKAMYTEYMAVTGGAPWITFMGPITETGWFYVCLWIVYIAFLSIAVLRLLTGIFMQEAMRAAEKDATMAIKSNLAKLFESIESDTPGSISRADFKKHLCSSKASGYMTSLGIRRSDADKLFAMLDRSGDGIVDKDEFIEGCQSFRANAREIDVALTLRHLEDLQRNLRRGVSISVSTASIS